MKATSLILTLLAAAAPPVLAQNYVSVGDPGNPSDPATGFGSVAYTFGISQYEVTNNQYATFLNAKASSDPNGLYSASMNADANGGIIQFGISGAYTYSVKAGQGNQPVIYVSFLDAMRYANWLNNGQGSAADTETGAYTLSLGGLAPRSAGAQFWIPSENEWYKAAYYQPVAGGDAKIYRLYPTGSNVIPNSSNGSASDANSANFYYNDSIANGFNGGYAVTNSPNFSGTQNYLTDVGAFRQAGSYYGTFDQGGNVFEWNESVVGSSRGTRGGWWGGAEVNLRSSVRYADDPATEDPGLGFRVAVAPEPMTATLALLGAAATFATRRR